MNYLVKLSVEGKGVGMKSGKRKPKGNIKEFISIICLFKDYRKFKGRSSLIIQTSWFKFCKTTGRLTKKACLLKNSLSAKHFQAADAFIYLSSK